MKNTFRVLLPLLTVALLSGCMTQRSVSFPNRDYDSVFKGAVAGLCTDPDLIVYEADKTNGIIRVQGRGMMGGAPDTALHVAEAGGVPTVSITLPGVANPWAPELLDKVQAQLPPVAAPSAVPAQQQKENLDFEKEKLELERQKLQLEREKLELEKQKQQQKQP